MASSTGTLPENQIKILQFKVLSHITNAPPYKSNSIHHNNLNIPSLIKEPSNTITNFTPASCNLPTPIILNLLGASLAFQQYSPKEVKWSEAIPVLSIHM